MAYSRWEYKRGDIISEIGGLRKYIVIGEACQFGNQPSYILAEYVGASDYLSMPPSWIDRKWCEENCVKVGLYDFEEDKEVKEGT